MQLIPSYSQSSSDRSASPKAKNRMMSSNQQPAKLNVNNSGPVSAGGDNMNKRNNQNKLMFNRNVNPAMSMASTIQKNVNTTGICSFILTSENIT